MTNVLILENHNKISFFFLVNNRSQYWGIIANEVLQPRFPRLGVQDTGHVEEGESCWSWLPSGNRNQDSKETWKTRICRGMLTCSVYVLIYPRRPRRLRLMNKIQPQERAWRLANSIFGGSREGARGWGGGEVAFPLIVRPNLKHFLETSPPTLSRGLDEFSKLHLKIDWLLSAPGLWPWLLVSESNSPWLFLVFFPVWLINDDYAAES